MPLGGYHSESFEREVNARIERDGRESVLLYAGDRDPSGEHIERNFHRYVTFDTTERIGLTQAQAIEHDLPAMPGKEADTRSGRFIAKYGSCSRSSERIAARCAAGLFGQVH